MGEETNSDYQQEKVALLEHANLCLFGLITHEGARQQGRETMLEIMGDIERGEAKYLVVIEADRLQMQLGVQAEYSGGARREVCYLQGVDLPPGAGVN